MQGQDQTMVVTAENLMCVLFGKFTDWCLNPLCLLINVHNLNIGAFVCMYTHTPFLELYFLTVQKCSYLKISSLYNEFYLVFP